MVYSRHRLVIYLLECLDAHAFKLTASIFSPGLTQIIEISAYRLWLQKFSYYYQFKMESINIPELIERLGSDEDAVRKMAVFKLQSNIGDPSFAEVFIADGGLTKLRYLTLHATGNTLAYSLTSFARLLEVDKGWEYVNQELLERVRLFRFVPGQRVTLNCTGCRSRRHPPVGQHPSWGHVHSCINCLPSTQFAQ